ncbi:fucose-binding lectin II [Burkholderia sp. BCC1999]|uniref:fucose-binding lectin II n=1 Tax=Burkholderia sp. BCC1999 TaxID=2817448 RepID=UPI002AC3379B|nr:fucose-binding lectin II [Burkholderia sp. BCC1999]
MLLTTCLPLQLPQSIKRDNLHSPSLRHLPNSAKRLAAQGDGGRNGNFTLPPNTDFKATFYANVADRQDLKLFIADAPEPAAPFTGNGNDGVRQFTLNSRGGKIRIDASANGRPSATDARLAPLSAGDTVWLGWLGAEDGADRDYNDAIVILQWPIT